MTKKVFYRILSFGCAFAILIIANYFNTGDTFYVQFYGILNSLFFMTLSILFMLMSND